MPADAVATVKSRLDIVDVVGGYVRLQRSGRSLMGLCPFHSERTPSFSVSQERQAWYCFGCQEGGDVISFVQKIERLDFMGALEMLAERAGVDLERDRTPRHREATVRRRRALELNARAQAFYEQVLWGSEAGAPGRDLLAERGVDESLARRFGVGFAPAGGAGGDALVRYLSARNLATPADAAAAGLAHEPDRGGRARDRFRHRLVFPIRDERGSVVGFGARALGDAVPKYLNSPSVPGVYDKSTALFGIDLARDAIQAAGWVLLVEGYFDVIAAHSAGVAGVVASSGTAFTPAQARLLKRFAPRVVMCFDGDAAGLAAASKAVDVVAQEGLEARIVVLPPGVKDPDDLVRRDPAGFTAAVEAARPEWEVLIDRAVGDTAARGSVEERRHAAERAVGVLARIPDAGARDLYVQRAAHLLDVRPEALAADTETARHAGPGRGRVTAVAPAEPAADTGLDEAVPGNPPSPWEQYIGRLVVQRPALAAHFAADHGLSPAEIIDPVVQRCLRLALETGAGEDFPLHALSRHEHAAAMRHLYRPVPELDDPDDVERLARAMSDCVVRLRDAARLVEIDAVRRDLRRAADDGRVDEVERLTVQLHRLSSERHRLREAAGA